MLSFFASVVKTDAKNDSIPGEPPEEGAAGAEKEYPAEQAHRHGHKTEDAIDRVVRDVAKDFNVPISLVSVLRVDRGFWKPATATPFAPAEKNPAIDEVLMSEKLVVIEDLTKDEKLATHALTMKRGVRFLATTPLRTRAGHFVGNLCVLDTQSRKLDEAQRQRLTERAGELMAALEPAEAEPVAADGTGQGQERA
jgi:GAF domain-containing protein